MGNSTNFPHHSVFTNRTGATGGKFIRVLTEFNLQIWTFLLRLVTRGEKNGQDSNKRLTCGLNSLTAYMKKFHSVFFVYVFK